MRKKGNSSGNTREQLILPGMESLLSSADLGDLRNGLGKNTHDPTWELTNGKKSVTLSAIDSHHGM